MIMLPLMRIENIFILIVHNRYSKYGLQWEWCDEFGFLLILTGITYTLLIYYHIVVRFFGETLNRTLVQPFATFIDRVGSASNF